MQRRPNHESLTRIRNNFAKLTAWRQLYPENLSFLARTERIATDSMFHWIWFRLTQLLINLQSENSPVVFSRWLEKAYGRAFTRWTFGRVISHQVMEVTVTLHQLYVPPRDLRLIHVCGFIKDNGQIHINWLREHALQAAWYLYLIVAVLAFGDLVIRTLSSSLNLPVAMLLLMCALAFFAIALYPTYVLCIRAPMVAKRLTQLSRSHIF